MFHKRIHVRHDLCQCRCEKTSRLIEMFMPMLCIKGLITRQLQLLFLISDLIYSNYPYVYGKDGLFEYLFSGL